jgi:hypothetical protein
MNSGRKQGRRTGLFDMSERRTQRTSKGCFHVGLGVGGRMYRIEIPLFFLCALSSFGRWVAFGRRGRQGKRTVSSVLFPFLLGGELRGSLLPHYICADLAVAQISFFTSSLFSQRAAQLLLGLTLWYFLGCMLLRTGICKMSGKEAILSCLLATRQEKGRCCFIYSRAPFTGTIPSPPARI